MYHSSFILVLTGKNKKNMEQQWKVLRRIFRRMRSVGNSMKNERHREKWRRHSYHYSSSQRASCKNEILHPRNVAVTDILFLNFFGGSFLTYLIQLKHFQKANQMGKAQGYRTGSQGAPAWTGWQIGRFHCTEISTLRTPPQHTCKASLYTSP